MSGDEEPTAPVRIGNADLARRMDRMERRQDNFEQELRGLSQTVLRVEENQKHATQLNELRFNALDKGVTSIDGQFKQFVEGQFKPFVQRFEGILSGEVETNQTRQGLAIVQDFTQWRQSVNSDIADLKDARETAQARSAGRLDTLSWAKTILISAAVLAGPVVAIIDILK